MILRSSAAPHIYLSYRRALSFRNSSRKSIWVPYSTSPEPQRWPETYQKKRPRKPSKQYPPREQDGKINQQWLKKELAMLDKSKPVSKSSQYRNMKGDFSELSKAERDSIYGKSGHKKREDYEDLSMPRLGGDGKVLVLRDSVVSNYYLGKRGTFPKPAAHIDIMGQIDAERGLPLETEVRKNIENLRPKPGQDIPTLDDFGELFEQLHDGFTIRQLESYIEMHKAEESNPKEKRSITLDHAGKPAAIATPWRSGISDYHGSFDNDALRAYILDSYTRKQKIVSQLLVECWEVEATEITDGIGQFEIEICNSKDLELLLVGPTSALDKLYTSRLNLEGENLEVFRSRSTIRITTTETKRDWVLEGFNEWMSKLHREKIQLEEYAPTYGKHNRKSILSWVERTFDDRTLKEVAKLVQISLTRSHAGRNTIEAAAVQRTEHGKPDNRWHALRRLLMMASTVVDRTKHKFATDTPSGNQFVPYTLLDGLNWWARLRKWTRSTAPISKIAAEKPASMEATIFSVDQPLEARARDQPIRALQNAAELLPRSLYKKELDEHDMTATDHTQIDGPWTNSHFTRTTATFGAVLHGYHPNHPINSDGAFDILHEKASLADSHEFSTHVPNLSRFISNTSAIPIDSSGSSLVLRFRPNPFAKSGGVAIGGAALHDLPTIEMHFSIGAAKKKTLKDVYAIVEENRTDIMLPQNAVDVRFTQKTISRWMRRRSDFTLYVEKCDLDNPNMEVYPEIEIPITAELCLGSGLDLLQPLSRPKDLKLQDATYEGPRKQLDVPYLFAGLEMRKQVTMKFQGWTVSYTNIEAGKSGGKRGELTLKPIKEAEMASEEEFVEMAYKIASVLGGDKPEEVKMRIVRAVKSSLVRAVTSSSKTVRENAKSQAVSYFAKRILQEGIEEEDERFGDESQNDGEKGSVKTDVQEKDALIVEARPAEEDDGSEDVPFEDQRSNGKSGDWGSK